MTAVYALVGASELGWKYGRMLAGTAIALWFAANCLGSVVAMRYVAEVEDG
jgi:hypothetical protein